MGSEVLPVLLYRDCCVLVRPRVTESHVIKVGSQNKNSARPITSYLHARRQNCATANARMLKFVLYKQRSPVRHLRCSHFVLTKWHNSRPDCTEWLYSNSIMLYIFRRRKFAFWRYFLGNILILCNLYWTNDVTCRHTDRYCSLRFSASSDVNGTWAEI